LGAFSLWNEKLACFTDGAMALGGYWQPVKNNATVIKIKSLKRIIKIQEQDPIQNYRHQNPQTAVAA